MRSRWWQRVACLLAMSALAACSLTFMKRAPADPRMDPRCSNDNDMPWLDVGLAGAEGLLGTATVISGATGERNGGVVALGVALMGMAAAHAYSASRGFEYAHECRELQARHERTLPEADSDDPL